MKYELTTPLRNIDGTPIKGPDGSAVTFKTAAVASLVQAQDREPADKYAAFLLAVKVEACQGSVLELEAEEVARLKRLVGTSMPVVIMGRMFELLDQK